MAMSPEEIIGKTFQIKFRGLNPDEVTAHLELLAGEFSALQERVVRLEKTVDDQKKELELAADDKKAFEDVADVFKDNIEKLKSGLRVKEQNGLELLQELESMRGRVTELVEERDGLKGTLNAKDTQISELESKYRMSRAAVDELRKKQVLLETENTDSKDRAEEHEQQLAKAREEFNGLAEQARNDSSRLVEVAKEEIERMRKNASLEIVQLKDDIEALSARRNQIQSELRSLLNNHLSRLEDFSLGNRDRNLDQYDDLFQKIDFAELAEFDDDPSSDDGNIVDVTGLDDGDSDEQLKTKLEDGGIAYLSGD